MQYFIFFQHQYDTRETWKFRLVQLLPYPSERYFYQEVIRSLRRTYSGRKDRLVLNYTKVIQLAVDREEDERELSDRRNTQECTKRAFPLGMVLLFYIDVSLQDINRFAAVCQCFT